MKADPKAQHELLDIVVLDTQLRQLAHRLGALSEADQLAIAKATARNAADEAAVVAMRIEDVDREIAKREGDLDAVRQRKARDEELLKSGTLDSRVQTDVQHELSSLRKRQAAFEAELLELMGRREEEHVVLDQARTRRSLADAAAEAAAAALAQVEVQLKEEFQLAETKRKDRVSGLPTELSALYERLQVRGVAAGRLDGRRCGACRLELTPVEVAQICAAAPEDVVRCPECEAILIRTGA